MELVRPRYLRVTTQDTNLNIPPPITRPHLIKYSVFTFTILVCFFRRKSHLIAECRVANQFSDTFDRVAFPEIQYLFSVCPLLIELITFYFETLTFPFCSMREAVNTLIESTLVPK